MATVLRFKPDVNALAVYQTANALVPEDAPVNDPLNNLGVIKFHSNLRYPRFIPSKVHDFTHEFTFAPNNRVFKEDIQVYAHGMSNVPVVFAKVLSVTATIQPNLAPANTPWCGSVPLCALGRGGVLFGTVGANQTHVVLRLLGSVSDSNGDLGKVTIKGRVYILDTTIIADSFAADPTQPMLTLEGTRIRVGRGKFDTNFSYMRQGSTTDPVVLVKGESMVITGTPNSSPLSDRNQNWGYRYSVDGKSVNSFDATGDFAAAFTTAGL